MPVLEDPFLTRHQQDLRLDPFANHRLGRRTSQLLLCPSWFGRAHHLPKRRGRGRSQSAKSLLLLWGEDET